MRRRIRAPFVIFSSMFCLCVVYTLFFFTRKSKMFRLNAVSQELSRKLTGGNSNLALNAEGLRQDGVNTITRITSDVEPKLRKTSDPVGFRIFQDNNDHLMYLYDRLLTAIPWEANPRNLAEFREKLMNHTNSTFQEEFVLTHQNVMTGDLVPYSATNSKPNRKAKFFTISKKFMVDDVPPASPLSGKRFKRCSVVGNSGLLSNSKCGQEIDQSDYVIRYKSLKTKETIISFVKAIGDYYGVLWLPCVASTAMIGLCLKAKHTLDNYNVENPESIIANPSHYLAVMDFWKEKKLTQFITTGFYMTHLSLTMCEETHLFGFWPFPYKVPDRVTETGTNTMKKLEYHYFDKIGASAVHSLNDEFSVLLQMHALGLLKLHVRDCAV